MPGSLLMLLPSTQRLLRLPLSMVGVKALEWLSPVTNKMLRHYFNIQDEDEVDNAVDEEPVLELQPETLFTARFLGADNWRQDEASIFGFVLDAQGRGVSVM